MSESIECDSDLTVAKYHRQASSVSAATTPPEATKEGWKGITKSAGKIFDLPSERMSNWKSAANSIL